MKPNLTDILCTRCGLCCDGSLFADVELAGSDETTSLEVMGLEIEDADEGEGGLLLQPCRALKGKRCSIYPHRPDCCRTFECRLLQKVKRGEVGIEQGKQKIAETMRRIKRVEALIGRLGRGTERLPLKERCGEALRRSERSASDQEANQRRAELQTAITSMERLIKETFLGD